METNSILDAIMFIMYMAIGGLCVLAIFFTIEYGIAVFGFNKKKSNKK